MKVIDVALAPFNAGPGALVVGATWYFQFGYRAVPAGAPLFNLSDSLSVHFCS
ncbi:MAG: hypothetical protein ACI841_004696 [Planctomycetota bacterium]